MIPLHRCSKLDLTAPCRRTRRSSSGFTLVELMVAITGGLFVSIIVFSISKNSARFYQSETRVGEATLGGMVGFERLRADIARAGFLSSPNIRTDTRVCGGPPGATGFPTLLDTLSSVQVTQDDSQLPNNPNLFQDSILLAGSYSSIDHFAMRAFQQTNAGYTITLDPASGAMTRLGYDAGPSSTQGSRETALGSVFMANRAVRIVDRSNKHYYGIVASVNAQIATEPSILLAATPAIQRQQSGSACGIDQCTGCVVNVVNFIRYEVLSIAASPGGYAPLFADGGAAPFDNTRMELVRTELDPGGGTLAGTTPELVAQYAVDLKFGLIVDDRAAGAQPTLLAYAPGSAEVANETRFHRIRGVRARLSVRTREGDREVDMDQTNLPAGLYRVGLGPDGERPFARVRTQQTDIMLNNAARFEEP
jgi:hypothetical protein